MVGRKMTYQVARRMVLALPVLAAVTGGCSWKHDPKPDSAGPAITTDPAMERRDWALSHAYFANGNVEAGPTRFPYTYRTTSGQGYGEYTTYLLDPVAFAYQTIRFPFTYIKTKPYAPTTYTGVEFEETYTAVPPQPEPETPGYVGVGTGMGKSGKGSKIGVKDAPAR